MAEGVGFEPTSRLRETVFKTAAFSHSAIPPHSYLAHFLSHVSVVVNLIILLKGGRCSEYNLQALLSIFLDIFPIFHYVALEPNISSRGHYHKINSVIPTTFLLKGMLSKDCPNLVVKRVTHSKCIIQFSGAKPTITSLQNLTIFYRL